LVPTGAAAAGRQMNKRKSKTPASQGRWFPDETRLPLRPSGTDETRWDSSFISFQVSKWTQDIGKAWPGFKQGIPESAKPTIRILKPHRCVG